MDLSAYNLLDTFTLHDASYLLCGYEPLSPGIIPCNDPHEIVRHKASTVADQLVSDAKNGKLVANKRDIGEAWYLAGAPEWIVTRQAFIDWANAKNIKPAFLFPGNPQEQADTINNKKESARKTENLCRAIACLAIDGYRYNPNDSKSSLPKELSEMMSGKFNVEISDRTIRNWIKEGIENISINPHKS